ncbi:5'-methylthioadenosine/adenosylhomocysteine nucleosidase [Treponema sp. OMZ 840]|uniref:5'-methylthioadenosine/adenosylhomocysteine nucleosidase n=1 Tax=Treponema sp. OMZ 840 TaxID=244313 RepID=UPI003D8C8FFC
MKIGVIGAMAVEVEYLKEILTEAKTVQKNGLFFYEGLINGKKAVIVQSGVGKVNAAMCAALLIHCFSVTHVINTGVAGGIKDGLHVFDVVVSSDAVHHDVDATGFGYKPCEVPGVNTIAFKADPFLIECTKNAWNKYSEKPAVRLVEGRVASGDVFVNTAGRREDIRSLCNPACVEMEGAAVAQVCYLCSVPFVIIRSISDMAENTDEVYEEKKAAKISAVLVANMFGLL